MGAAQNGSDQTFAPVFAIAYLAADEGVGGKHGGIDAAHPGNRGDRAGIAVDHRLEGYFEVETELAGAQAVNRGKA